MLRQTSHRSAPRSQGCGDDLAASIIITMVPATWCPGLTLMNLAYEICLTMKAISK